MNTAGKAAVQAMTNNNGTMRYLLGGLMLMGALALTFASGGCARRGAAADAWTATASATVSPQLPPTDARRDANARAETQARDQLMIQAGQVRVPDGRTLEDVGAADSFVRAMLFDTVRGAHMTAHTPSAEGVISVTLTLEKSSVQRIVDEYARLGGK